MNKHLHRLALLCAGSVFALASCQKNPDEEARPASVATGRAAAVAARTCPTSVFGSDAQPAATFSDGEGVELGTKVRTRGAIAITGLRFYKSPNDPATSHVGHLWTNNGELLKTVTFTNETASGWQEALFDNAILPSSGSLFVASYYAATGHYVGTNEGLANGAGRSDGPIFAPPAAEVGGNGVFRYGSSSGFPTQTFRSSNYFVDVLVDDTQPPAAPSQLTATPEGNGIRLRWSPGSDGLGERRVNVARQLVFRDGQLLATVSGAAFSYNDSTGTPGTRYTYTIQGEDLCGNLSEASAAVSATAPGAATVASNIFGSVIPANAVTDPDTSPVEVGVKFKSSIDGFVTDIRVYRQVGQNSYFVHLWKADGTLLASGFTGQGGVPGWQRVFLSNPNGSVARVPINANEVYVASYYAQNGGYAAQENGLDNDITNGNLTALGGVANGGNGVFKYGRALPNGNFQFPNESYKNTNYFVDVEFSTRAMP